MKKVLVGMICVALIVSVTAFSLVQAAEKKDEKKLEFKKLHDLMERVKKDCGALVKAKKKGDFEATAKQANALAKYAEIAQKKFCPSKDFFQKAEAMKKGAKAVAEAAGKKNAAGVTKAFKSLATSCADCHKVYKKKKK